MKRDDTGKFIVGNLRFPTEVQATQHRQRLKVPDAWKPIVGTLAHNRSFQASEISEYTRFDRRLNGSTIIRTLLRANYIQRVNEGYSPTSAGWTWIEG